MFVETKTELTQSQRYPNGTKRRINVFRCDQCGQLVGRTYRKRDVASNTLSFCDDECRNEAQSGLLAEKKSKVSQERYGCHYTQLDSVKQKMLGTRLERYGTVAPVHEHEETKRKYQETMLERHGTVDPLPAARQAFKEKHGVSSPWALPEVRAKNDLSEAGQKGFISTHNKLGKAFLSRPEQELYDWLCDHFGNDDVVSTYPVVYHDDKERKWLIDCYVRSIDTYIQLDGEFWHGLDRPFEELKAFPKTLRMYENDRKQDAWFKKKGLRLVRVTDKQWQMMQKTGDFSHFIQALGG